MKALSQSLAMIVVAGSLLATAPAYADREPTAEERARIETVLRQAGFQRWEEIEHDDGLWEVDDAIDTSGREWDLKLDPQSFAIVKRVED